ncbi:MAG: hypothetical protein P8M30_13550 [Planctomycetaceae bacterium]|jgi:hypothetical protein|nr:hypothetical protein [Planctomycetaceae bacterium]
MDHSIESMTLQDKVKKSEVLVREMIEHLELGFLPKLKNLQKISRVGNSQSQLEDIADLTVRNHVVQVLESEQFTESLFEKLSVLTNALEKDMNDVLYGK